MIVLDTHVLLWLVSGDENLGKESKELIDKAFHNKQNQQLAVSAITFWEIAMLKKKSRIEFTDDIGSWRKEITRQGIKEIPVNGEIGVFSTALEDFHAGPADRFIVASSIINNANLITADRKILNWQGKLNRHDARK